MDDGGALLPPARARRGRHPRPQRDARATRTIPRPTRRPSPTAGSAPATRATSTREGYLRLTGRLKEIINRGGEKVEPARGRTVLMDHPAVAQCLTFAMPHPMLGEEVAAAIVLREGQTATDHELRDFAAERLAAFKVPRKIVFLDEIPKGATGKLQRIGLAEKLGLTGVKVAIFGAGAIGGAARREAGASRRRRHLHRARPASGGDAGERRHAASAARAGPWCIRAASPTRRRRACRTTSSSR